MTTTSTTTTTTSSTTTTTFYVPDSVVGFTRELVSSTFTRESITFTFSEVLQVSDRKPKIETIYKQASEIFSIYGEFSSVLATGETLVVGSSSVVATDVDGTAVTSSLLQGLSVQSVTKLATTLKAYGTVAASPYKVTFTAVTSLGNKYEIDGEVRIVEL